MVGGVIGMAWIGEEKLVRWDGRKNVYLCMIEVRSL